MGVSSFQPTKQELQELHQFYSCEKIGQMYGVSAECVRTRMHKLGAEMKPRGSRRAFDPPRELLYALYQEKSMRQIADHFGVGETVVFNRLKEHGIELKEHKNHRLKTGRVLSEQHKASLKKARRSNVAHGADNPNWKGGLTEVHRKLRGSWQYRDWKAQSLERAGYKCELCGAGHGRVCECCGTKVVLHVHHIKSFAKFPDDRFDPENSEVLCPKCHFTVRHQRKSGELLETP